MRAIIMAVFPSAVASTISDEIRRFTRGGPLRRALR